MSPLTWKLLRTMANLCKAKQMTIIILNSCHSQDRNYKHVQQSYYKIGEFKLMNWELMHIPTRVCHFLCQTVNSIPRISNFIIITLIFSVIYLSFLNLYDKRKDYVLHTSPRKRQIQEENLQSDYRLMWNCFPRGLKNSVCYLEWTIHFLVKQRKQYIYISSNNY